MCLKRKLSARTMERIVKMIPDMEAYVKVASSCEDQSKYIVATLLHDILGTVTETEFFCPRTSGYSAVNKD